MNRIRSSLNSWLAAVAGMVTRIVRGQPEISPAGTLLLAVWFGGMMGLAEAAHLATRHLIERHPAAGFSWVLVWMGPISSALAFGALGRISLPVSIRDIQATIFEPISGRPDSRLPGKSLSRFWSMQDTTEGGAHSVVPPEPLYAETNWAADAGIHDWEPLSRGNMKSFVLGDMYYILNGDGVEELYDLRADPDEERDVSARPQMAAVMERARAGLDSMLRAGR